MMPTEWEWIEEALTSKLLELTNWGPLQGPITNFKITRNEKLQLILETTSAGQKAPTIHSYPAGTVREATDWIKFSGKFIDAEAIAVGVTPIKINTTFVVNNAEATSKETSQLASLRWTLPVAGETAHTMDWIENVPDSYLWPNVVRSEKTKTTRKEFSDGEVQFVVKTQEQNEENNRSNVHLCIDGQHIFFEKLAAQSIPAIKAPGLIFYEGKPTPAFRRKIIDALSFAFGRYLIYLGTTEFNKHWGPTIIEAVSPTTLNGAAFDLPTLPPTPLGDQFQWEVNRAYLERLVGGIFDTYDRYHLQSVLWQYWYAVSAPVHSSSVNFGAAIEAIQSAFFQGQDVVSNKVLATEIWQKFSRDVKAWLSKSSVDSNAKELLVRKIDGLNFASQSVQTQRFLEFIQLELGPVEMSAWKKGRNRAAHGGHIAPENFVDVVRQNKVLRVLLVRVILSIADAADCYYDYYTVNQPISPLKAAIPADEK